MPDPQTITFTLTGRKLPTPALPRVLESRLRSADPAAEDPFLPRGYVQAVESFDLSATARSTAEGQAPKDVGAQAGQVIALELADGLTIFTSPEGLRETLARVAPGAIDPRKGKIDLDALRRRGVATRGEAAAAAPNLITRFTQLDVGAVPDAILEAARRWLREKIGDQAGDLAELGVSWLGTKALMWAIESRLGRAPGLYRWVGAQGEPTDLLSVGDARLEAEARQGPLLVFIHGTASSTVGSYEDLQTASREYWRTLEERFGERIYAFEHRTLSESPIENALQLARALPRGARLNLVTHSRGGLVGDLLCLNTLEDADRALVDAYAVDAIALGETEGAERERLRQELELAYGEQRAHLRELAAVLRDRQFVIERYVRVACPAHGTRLASANFDVFLSALLQLVGLVPAVAASPLYSAFRRVVLEIAKNRTRPGLVPGIEAMLPESPMARLLKQARPRAATQMAVIAGDIEGDRLLKRLGVFFTDHVFFSGHDNDLVVDTDSMYAGVARALGARALFDQGPEVSHFRYFRNDATRAALRRWLLDAAPDEIEAFGPLPGIDPEQSAWAEFERIDSARRTRAGAAEALPVVVVLPGIMGSHLWVNRKDRVWFDFGDLVAGGLAKIAYPQPNVEPERLFGMFYGDLCAHLARSHRVEPFPYDWRRPLDELADTLAQRLQSLLEATAAPARPVRILAHSMGGLVVRALVHKHPALWDTLMQRDGSRFVMLGTPNQGSFLMVETLLGKSDTIRTLARIDLKHPMQGVLDIVAGFPGALQLLPRPGFRESVVDSPPHATYYDPQVWAALKPEMRDFWFGDGVAALPSQHDLDRGAWLWQRDHAARPGDVPALPEKYKDRVWYVHGCGSNTPCGLAKIGGRWRMLGTPRGDGSVTWESGAIGGIGQRLYMPAEHGALADTREYFDSLAALLARGEPGELLTTPPAARELEAAAAVPYDAGPPVYPSADELAAALIGRRPRARGRARAKPVLKVRVRAADLREVPMPILVGHYEQDPISGPESLIDREVVGGALGTRYNLGLYAGPLGSATVVLQARNEMERGRGSRRGAVVAGLGPYDGSLTVSSLTDAVRAATLRYLLHLLDHPGDDAQESAADGARLASLLLGYNSSVNLSVADAVGAIVRGVAEANRRFSEAEAGRGGRDSGGEPLRVAELEIVELYLDTAISATYALRQVASTLNEERGLRCRIEAEPQLQFGEGVRQRLEDARGAAYWPRMIVTDADRREDECPPECYDEPRPPEGRDKPRGGEEDPCAAALVPDRRLPAWLRQRTALAQRLRYLFLGQRARAETEVQQRQPGLIEQIVALQLHRTDYQPDLSRTLFQLLVPHDFKDAARQLDRVVVVVDGYTANLPWELMLAGDRPLAVRTAMVRQLSSTRYRARVRQSPEKRALVVGNPSCTGFLAAFPDARGEPQSLPEAEKEAYAVADVLRQHDVEVTPAIGSDQQAVDVINLLYQHPYRVLHIAAHGIFEQKHADGRARSGVVLSCGLLITAAEIGSMEVVPDLVFLNCCHLGKVDRAPAALNRLAYSVARELIEIGVRAVVVAGWAVHDDAARLFAETFYWGMLAERKPFGDAVFDARKAVWERYPNTNTWGAYQAYGDPGWRLEPGQRASAGGEWRPVAPQEVVARIDQLRADIGRMDRALTPSEAQGFARQLAEIERRVPDRKWLARPDVCIALGRAYGDLGSAWFDKAIAYLQQAIERKDARAPATVQAIEQLANFEARLGEERNDPALVQRAIDRLLELVTLVAGKAEAAPPPKEVRNEERIALLGSAYKRLAAVHARASLAATDEAARAAARAAMRAALCSSADWYRGPIADVAAGDIDPYPGLNWAFVETLLALDPDAPPRPVQPEQLADFVRRCGQAANARFAAEPNYWNAIMAADALLAEALLPSAAEAAGAAKKVRGAKDAAESERITALAARYEAARTGVQVKPKDFDSTVSQICLLALFFEALGQPARAKALRELAELLLPGACQRDETKQAPGGAEEAPAAPPPRPAAPEGGAGALKPARSTGRAARKRRSG